VGSLEDIRKGGDKAAFPAASYALLPGWSYRDMWWVTHNEHGAYAARGIHGQAIYIDPKAEMVIARHSRRPQMRSTIRRRCLPTMLWPSTSRPTHAERHTSWLDGIYRRARSAL
jgi:CubicO group peptidase (beta-lactamase class C family)